MSPLNEQQIESVLNDYPPQIKTKLKYLRKMIHTVASEAKPPIELEETLKWGELSYLAKNGSTLRIGSNTKSAPDEYALYVNCQTSLIRTYKKLYPKMFNYQGKRAIVFNLTEKIPQKELKHCIELSLKYHKLKNKPPFTSC